MSATDPATLSRHLLRSRPTASLATVMNGGPYASLVLVAVDHDAMPILLISQLAEHTKNLAADPRVALLFEETEGLEEPLTGPRVTLLGRAEVTTEPRHRERFLARHPGAAAYAGFKDFAFHRIAVERAHLVAGFGRIYWIDGRDLLGRVEPALAEREAGIVEHMNTDHGDAVQLYATVLLRQPAGDWRLTGCDPEGVDLRCGNRTARLDFGRRVTDADGARAELVRLVKKSRRIA
jgi:putative heme iron utilization protein